jgi:hypothetical protein
LLVLGEELWGFDDVCIREFVLVLEGLESR